MDHHAVHILELCEPQENPFSTRREASPQISHARRIVDPPRISVSSSISRPPSFAPSTDSHIYFDLEGMDIPKSRLRTGSGHPHRNEDRDSFIELASPPLLGADSDNGGDISPLMPTFVDPDLPSSARSSLDLNDPLPVRPPVSPRSLSSSSIPRPPKPPVPTAPKPKFRPSSSARSSPLLAPSSPQSRPGSLDIGRSVRSLPPTTNVLNPQERAELIRKTRKLTQVFGKTPAASVVAQALAPPVDASSKRGRHRFAASVIDEGTYAAWPPPEDTKYISANPRRYSTPLSSDQISFLSSDSVVSLSASLRDLATTDDEGPVEASQIPAPSRVGAESPTSFMELQEADLSHDDTSSIMTAESPKLARRRPGSPKPSLWDGMSPEEVAEEERRQKRERLAKLHRFLGSRIPAGLVLGTGDDGPALPPVAPDAASTSDLFGKGRVQRRRSSSAAAFPTNWSPDVDRVKEDLDEREKAINVRRAAKMEKLFGVLPPQTLYHTRQKSVTFAPGSLPTSGPLSSSPGGFPSSPTKRNVNQSAYSKAKAKGKKRHDRPATPESSRNLLSRESTDTISEVYMHYRHSLNSLNAIIDRDDKESIAQLHEYLNGERALPPIGRESEEDLDQPTNSSSVQLERRRSLPSRPSIVSLSSEFNSVPPSPEMTEFQLRRRKAAKLTSFFGVDYRDVIGDLLESIEKGVEEESGKGNLNADEVQDLMLKLRRLRSKRNVLTN
ncbi:hypothetical protein JAAARDRAFT_29034 [Jaapia argillacea MUCL 33604]|uniref:Uncharacterized protein n=1 Tax=Jaapia argillacea MUCL 33604 TaxID=933084 RepID=A0A067QHQ7_9AGAM|nr:hypothetical protein JAAARDRAFT_29034 [Jaapia argillacea MUCL 33604]